MPKLNCEDYQKRGGNVCPACGQEEGLHGTSITVYEGKAYQEFFCTICSASWTDEYQLQGYVDLEETGNDGCD